MIDANLSPLSEETMAIPGTLSDQQIQQYCQKGLLISEGFDSKYLSGCTYEFRVGEIAYSYDYEKKLTRQQKGDSHIINPFETLTIITIEKVNLDSQHFLILFSKGSLFSLGLTAVSTAADPGFRGHLGITMTNLSARPIRFDKGVGFVKGCFIKLSKPARISYTGQHGDATMSWPYPSQFHLEPPNFESWKSGHWQYLPLPLRTSLIKLSYVERYLKWIVAAFATLVTANIIMWYLRTVLGSPTYIAVERIISTISALAQIAGFILAVALLWLNREGK